MKRFVQASVIAVSLVLSACSRAEAPPVPHEPNTPPPNTDMVETKSTDDNSLWIVMLGDSLTAGFGLPAEAALPEQMQTRLEAAGLNVLVVNAGVSGDTSANGLARYDWSVAAVDPDMVVIALGANDYLLGLSPDVTRANLAAIIERAQSQDVTVVLAGVEPRFDAPAGSRDAAFAAIYPDLAATYSLPVYPALLRGVRDNSELLQSDGLHPTAAGVEVIADQLAAFLEAELQAD